MKDHGLPTSDIQSATFIGETCFSKFNDRCFVVAISINDTHSSIPFFHEM